VRNLKGVRNVVMMTFKEFEKMKISQYENILVSKDMACPECNGSSQFDYSIDRNFAEPTPIGWCDTVHGFMAVFECPKCFAKYRFHINSNGRYDNYKFYQDFALLVHLYKQHQKDK